ncbi:MAG: AMP-binding protein [Spirochaetales bacterium]|nr:AMP-binding protein [Spirochaetales bacterium]
MQRTEPWAFLDAWREKTFHGEWPSLVELFWISVERFPERHCFTIYDPARRSLTYREALASVEAASRRLRADGVADGDRVAVSGKNGVEWAVAYLAALFAGAVVVPIDAQLSDVEIDNLLKASGARAFFVDGDRASAFPPEKYGMVARYSLTRDGDRYALELDAPAPAAAPRKATADDLAAILFTSGTTGIPKGVMLSHGNLVSDCLLAQANLSIFPTDVFYAVLPIHHSYTMLAVFIEAISVGAEIVFGKRLVAKQMLKDFREAGVTMFLGAPILFNKLLAGIMKGIREKGPLVHGILSFLMAVSGLVKKVFKVNPGKKLFHTVLDKAGLTTIRICISGGGPLAPSVFRKYNQLGIDFVQGYGLTETSPIITLNPIEHYKETSVGALIPRTEMKVLEPDAEGRGVLAVKGPMVMQGYYNNPEATAEVFTEDGWFITGDVGWIDDENYVYLTGRAKNMIVTEGGKNVYPEEIENAFQLFDEVDQVLVRGWIGDESTLSERIEALLYPNPEWFAAAAARGELADDRAAREKRMKETVDKVNATLLPYQRIDRVTVLAEPLEMTTTKKIKRHAAR